MLQRIKMEAENTWLTGSGLVVSVIVLYSDDLSWNTAEAISFFCKLLFEKNKTVQKGPELSHLNKIVAVHFET